jgi:membrane protease YdiL (CAAX protease family)
VIATQPSRLWAAIELALGVIIIGAGLLGYIPLTSTPALLAAGAIFVWWRGPGWRGLGLPRPTRMWRVVALGLAAGAADQFFGLYVLEPLIARMTSGALPDVSAFRPLVGNRAQLALWLAMSWTIAAFLEEMVYRGWLMNRIAELWRFSAGGWTAALLLSSGLFGIVHLYQGASGVIATGLSGLVFGSLYLATGRNLWASIFAHGFMDTIGFLMIYFGIYPGL